MMVKWPETSFSWLLPGSGRRSLYFSVIMTFLLTLAKGGTRQKRRESSLLPVFLPRRKSRPGHEDNLPGKEKISWQIVLDLTAVRWQAGREQA
jgi:hypothetical protein